MSFIKRLKNINFKSKEEIEREQNKKLSYGIFIGTSIGAVFGALLNTEKGKDVTKQVVLKGKDVTKQAISKAKDISEKSRSNKKIIE